MKVVAYYYGTLKEKDKAIRQGGTVKPKNKHETKYHKDNVNSYTSKFGS